MRAVGGRGRPNWVTPAGFRDLPRVLDFHNQCTGLQNGANQEIAAGGKLAMPCFSAFSTSVCKNMGGMETSRRPIDV